MNYFLQVVMLCCFISLVTSDAKLPENEHCLKEDTKCEGLKQKPGTLELEIHRPTYVMLIYATFWLTKRILLQCDEHYL